VTRLVAASAALALLLLPAAAAEAAKRKPKPCYGRGTYGIEATKLVRIYDRRRGDETTTYACWRRTGLRTELASGDDYLGFGDQATYLTLMGRFLAYRVGSVPDDTQRYNPNPTPPPPDRIVVLDVSRGERSAWSPSNPATTLVSFALSADGRVAWTAGDLGIPGVPPPPESQVFAARKGAPTVTLDSGPDVETRSLAIIGTTVTWLRGGQPRSAPLP
jgi:hypothetical protein